MNKKVSIIVPIYKVEMFLQECVDCILNQSYQDIEVILVDDGSPDGCPALCDDYAERDKRVRVVHKKNGGLSDARNAGLEVATGEYICFCDSDDFIAPNTIEILVSLAQKYNVDIVSCESRFYSNGKEQIIERYHKEESLTFFTGISYIKGFCNYSTDCSVCNKLYRASVIGNNRFEVGKTNEDLLFQFDVLLDCHKIVHTNQGLYKYRINDSGITHTFNNNSINVFYNAKKLLLKLDANLPELHKDGLYYLVNNSYYLSRLIIVNNKNNVEPFKSALKEIRKVLIKNTLFILTNNKYGFMYKLKLFYSALSI